MLTNDKDKELQAELFANSKCKLKPGDKAKHKINTDLQILVTGYSKQNWTNDLSKLGKFENPEYLICQSYNAHTHVHLNNVIYACIELEPDNSSDDTPLDISKG